MIEKILLLAILLTFCSGIVIAQKYVDFVAFELCTRTPGYSRDHEKLHVRKSSVRAVKEIEGRPDCSEIMAPGGYKVRVYGSPAETTKKLEFEDE